MIVREPRIYETEAKGFARIGRACLTAVAETGQCASLCLGGLAALRFLGRKRARAEVVRQAHVCSVKSLPVVSVVAFFIGMILALQLGLLLRDYNQEAMVGSAVMATMLREMGPFMSGLVLAASVGSAMAAQIGTMMVNEEVAALEILDIDPVRFLVMPRLAAMAFAVPALSFYTCLLGLLGGAVVSYTQLSVPWEAYWRTAFDFAETKALWVGLLKAFVFGLVIATVSCHEGFRTTHGAVGVGRATRRSVVSNFLLILVTGYFVTRLFY